MKNIPILIPVYNQLTYLRNLINCWQFYYPENPIMIIDNGSNYEPLLKYYQYQDGKDHVAIIRASENNFIKNLNIGIDNWIKGRYDYYVISDPDIMPHPATPPNFLEIWKELIDTKGYHHAGFNLIIDDLPEWLHDRDVIISNEKEFLQNPVEECQGFIGYKAPIDTSFALYTTKNSGWHAPMSGEDWSNSLRIFNAIHLPWYQHPDYVNPEMDHYYRTAKYRVIGEPSAGKNNNKPRQYHAQ